MKKLTYICCCLLGALAFSACEKEMDDYQGQDGLYFDVQYTDTPHFTNPEMWAHQLYTWVRFFSMPEGTNETQLSLKVNVVGEACDYDREFDVAVVTDSTTAVAGQEYKDLSEHCVIKAGETCGYVTLTVLRSERISDEVVQLQLTLLSNEYFNLPLTYLVEMPGRYSEELTAFYRNPDPRVHNIFISDVLTKPKLWPVAFGDYSNKKMEMFLEFYPNKSYDDYSTTSTLPTVVQNIIVEMTANYLIENFRAGNPITDPDGTMMYVKGVPWDETSMPEDVVLE